VSLNKTTLSLRVGGTEQLIATVAPTNADNKTVTWTSSAPAVATVNATDGTVTAVAAGTATITVTTDDGGHTATCVVTVSSNGDDVPVTGVTISKASTTVLLNATEQLSATISPANATNQNVTWSRSHSNIVTVSANGMITGVAEGEATVTVTTADGSFTAQCTITVSSTAVSVTGVTLNKTTLSLGIGKTEKLTATIAPSTATNQNVAWSSSAAAVATVATDGTVTAVAKGTATITVTTDDGGKTATCAVTVTTATGVETPAASLARIYPNPTDGAVTLEFETAAARHITISDMSGKTLLRQTTNEQTVHVDISNYPAGVYLLTITEGKEQSTTRVVKN
jgi:uncharacterized protein YjdB